MISVVVFAQRADHAARAAAGALSGCFRVLLHTSQGIEQLGSGTEPCAVEAVSRMERLLAPQSVLVLADQSVPARLELSAETIVIAGTDNRRIRRLLSGRPNPVVTCGTGRQDTITLSSLSPERAVLCVQRELPVVDGSWLEATELAVELCGCGLHSAMLAAGIAAVCGCPTDRVLALRSDNIITAGR